MFYQDLFRWILAWGRSRRWGRMVLWAAFPGLVFLVAALLTVYGALLTRQQLVSQYLPLVKGEVDARLNAMQTSATSTDKEELSIDARQTQNAQTAQEAFALEVDENGAPLPLSRQVLLVLRRIMHLGNFSERATYLVAAAMAEQGRPAMAEQLMREIAPVGGGGFPLAHAFLGDYGMARWKGTEAQAEVVLADYETANHGGAKMKVPQLRVFASLLLQADRKVDAISVLQAHAKQYPVLLGDIVQIEANEGSNARAALAAARAVFEEKRKMQTLSFEDLQEAVRLELLDNKIDIGLQLAEQGVQFHDHQNAAVRLLSTVLLIKHQAITEQRKIDLARAEALRTAPPPLDLQYLDRASRIDSSNPAVSQELAKALTMGQGLTEEMKTALEQSLIDGTATGVTHLILANYKLMGDDPQTALPELRVALLRMPNSPIVMNNLAYAIMKYDSKNLPEAKQLIQRALQIPGSSMAEQASMLDTLGDLRLAEEDLLGAIESFEDAIKLDGNKLNTRRKLAETYTKVGMPELAQGQLARVKELSQK